MSIGSRIKEARIKNGMTQEELANNIGITKGAIANYENGVSSPKVEILFRLFSALNCDANYLYQDDMNIMVNTETTRSPNPNELILIQKKIISDIKQMNTKELIAVQAVINALNEYRKSLDINVENGHSYK